MIMDENAWIDKVLQGDPAVYENLVNRYQARLVAFLWNLLGNGDDARDAAQDAFIQAYTRLGQFDRSRGFKSWLFAIAYHRGIDLLRNRRTFLRFRRREAASMETITRDDRTIEESLLWWPILGKVTPQERSVLVLKYNEGLDAADIAAILGSAESTVRVHLLNARRKLRKELQAAGFIAGAASPASAEEMP